MDRYIPPFDILDRYCQDSVFKEYYRDKKYTIKHRYNALSKNKNIANKENIKNSKIIHYDNGVFLVYSIGKLLYVKTNEKNTIKFKAYNSNDIPIILDIISIGEYGKIQSKLKTSHTSKWIYYYNVWIETEKNAYKLDNIEKRGRYYSIDHIVPIIYGYSNNICPLKIGGLKNLRVISRIDNVKKAQTVCLKELHRVQ